MMVGKTMTYFLFFFFQAEDGIRDSRNVTGVQTCALPICAEELFTAPRAGWQLARYHSPDVMIAASDTGTINRGDYSFVLGEVHVTSNTLRYAFMMAQHSNPQELSEAYSRDMVSPRVVPVLSRQWPRVTNRTSLAVYSPP